MANIIVTAEETTINVNTTTETVNVSTTFSNIVLGESTVVSVDESIFDNGNLSGNITLDIDNARIQTGTLVGNVTAISFVGLEAGRSGTILLKQDAAGGNYLDTTTFPAAWSNWTFANNFKDIDLNANEWNVISFFYDGVKIYASLIVQQALAINNSDLANSTITVNGTTISLGSAGNITHFGSLTTTNLPEGANQYYTTARARGALSAGTGIAYNNTTGVISLSDTGLISGVTAGSGLTGGGDSGNVTLNVGAGTGITVNADNVAVNMAAFTTTNLAEGTNLYFTAARARGNVSATTATGIAYDSGTGVFSLANIPNSSLTNTTVTINGKSVALGSSNTLTTSDIGEGTNLYYTDARANSAIATYTAANPLTIGGNLQVNGNINATGNINYQNVTDLYVTDQKITLNSNAAVNSNVEIISNRPAATNTMLKWNEQATRWEFTNDGTTYFPIATSTTDLAEGSNLWFTTARANSAIDNRLVGGTGISYTAGTIAVDFTEFNTDNIVEGTSNLWFSNARVNSFIQNNITTSDIDEGTNLYFTAARARGNISAGENITYNSTTGVIGLSNALANVNSVSTESGQNLTLNTNTSVVVRESIKGVTTNVGNISGDGYGIINGVGPVGNVLFHTGTGELNSYFVTTGNVTANSTTITGVTLNEISSQSPGASANLSVITPYYVIGTFGTTDQYPFPPGTYVTSVDVANSTITVNNPAAISLNFAASGVGLFPGAFDSSTGLLMGLISQFAAGQGALSRTTIQGQSIQVQGVYGYPATGPAPSNFVYSVDTANDYATGTLVTNKLFARTKIEGVRTVLQAPRGLVVGNGDLTNRAENDTLPSFGINVLWDGLTSPTTEYGSQAPFTQLLLKQYSDNSQAAGAAINSGPRILFTAARGNKNQSYLTTYPRINNELGRITWWGPTQGSAAPSTLQVPAYINSVTNIDYTTHNGGTGLYFVASPHTDAGRRGMFLSHHLGNTVITSSGSTGTGPTSPITFAPMTTSTAVNTAGNSIAMYNNIMAANNYQWASINYDNPTGFTGSRLSITNGASTVAGRNGNISLVLDRNDNGAGFGSKEWAFKLQPGNTSLALTEDDVVRASFASGGNVNISGNINLTGRLLGYDQVYGEFCYTGGNIVPAAPDTIYAFPLDTTNMASDIVANNTSRINIVKPGRFKLITSIQVKNADNTTDHIMRFWLRKNGADVANSATLITPLKLQEQVIAMDWMVESDGDDYFEIVYYVNDVDVTFPYYAAGTTPVTYPAAPPIIVNVIPVGA